MVIKTETCSFSELKIYPGHGSRYIRKDGTIANLINSKSKSLYLQKKKPSKLKWTIPWRRLNKKMTTHVTIKRRVRRAARVQRSIVGASVEEIKAKRNQKPEVRQKAREAALAEIKSRNKAKAAAPVAKKGEAKQAAKVSKTQAKAQTKAAKPTAGKR